MSQPFVADEKASGDGADDADQNAELSEIDHQRRANALLQGRSWNRPKDRNRKE
jgi:hypothetical protein